MPARTGAAGTGTERGEEDWVTQQSVWPQSQYVQAAFGGDTTGAPVVVTTCAHTSDRLNRMASAFLTGEL